MHSCISAIILNLLVCILVLSMDNTGATAVHQASDEHTVNKSAFVLIDRHNESRENISISLSVEEERLNHLYEHSNATSRKSYRHITEIKINSSYVAELESVTKRRLDIELRRLGQTSNDMIDVVITWVNSSDPSFMDEFYNVSHRKCGQLCSNSSIWNDRFRPSNEIYLNLMALCYQNTWVRTIFIVSNQVLDLSYFLPMCRKRIAFVTHKEIMPAEYLPIYNSNVIESYIHKIPNLSEIFVYLNDDIMFTQSFDMKILIGHNYPIHVPSTYFGNFLCGNQYNNPKIRYSAPHIHVYFNTHFMFSEKFQTTACYPWSFRGHAPYLQIKALNELASSIFPKELHRLLNNRFRYEVHYKLGGDFSLLYLSNYIGKYFGIIEFTDKLFRSTIPRKDDDYLKIWNDPTRHSIVMHDSYNLIDSRTRFTICSGIVTKVCQNLKSLKVGRCKELGLGICNKELIINTS